MNNQSHHKAFTLIEIVLYMFLFGLIIGSLSGIGILVATNDQSTYVRNQMVAEAGMTFNEIMRDMRAGKTIDLDQSDLGQNYSSIEFTNNNGDLINYQVDQVTSVLQKSINGGAAVDTHSINLNIEQFLIEPINPSNTIPIFTVTVTFSNDFAQQYNLRSTTNFIP
ncbi:hypothetical protein COV81_05245 [Candidatus Peregrinibacteria bacterium CG11_big_fil_rev_8_21_14_0_20_41_10]|nr:MAG: hypothetical protein COV81_05245 [Candidatus Peregrinibacteria bacterium CG11_big_fil_rev_8_21_14_0_20_41_10]PJC38316.1 MAG: hypothetical protein CO045_00920 [Candidatus Peregrinibacteria bacterium CG_4_9_14_0_2_um_filter_41_14]